MSPSLDKNQSVSVATTKVVSDDQKYAPKKKKRMKRTKVESSTLPPIGDSTVSTTVESTPSGTVNTTTTTVSTPVQQPPVQKKKGSLFGSIWLFIKIFLVVSLAGLMILFGYLFGTKIVPEINRWLIDHNFIEGDTNNIGVNPPQIVVTPDENGKNSALTIPDVVKQVSPAVVSIAVSNASLDEGSGVVQESDKIGTGFIVDAQNGIIVTNQHVVSNLNGQYQVVTQDDKILTVSKIVRDSTNDIALVIVEDKSSLRALQLGDSEKINVGETVIAIGTPLGQYPGSVTVGVVSGLGRTVRTSGGFWGVVKEYENVIQTDAAVNPGNSGGPLLNGNGQVIGVNFATTGGADNISFALPINVVKTRLAEYAQYGRFRNAYVGINYAMVTPREAQLYGVVQGAFVRGVVSGSPAAVAGIKPGDIIIKIGATKVTTGIGDVIQRLRIDQEVDFTVWRQKDGSRDGEEVVVKVKVSEAPLN
ncbi:MAG: trypsin-like peptidase domain-containing protein [Candidatus Dojkabacteria bacterium]|nr:MAG: trypsin-like peptidase domain-containing protein [Candidatus Dojkabacteria bacterium]